MVHALHDHHNRHGTALAQAARHSLLAAGEQWTDMRAAVFAQLSACDQPSSAYLIAEKVSGALGRRVVPNSIYRILDLFVANNLAMRVESCNGFLVNPHPDCVHDCIFLICDGCGFTNHVDDDVVADKVRRAASRNGFAPQRPVIEVHGRCRSCASAVASAPEHAH